MEIQVNGERRNFEQSDAIHVGELLDLLEIVEHRGLAVAINTQVIPKSRWNEVTVVDGDAVEIIRATQGG